MEHGKYVYCLIRCAESREYGRFGIGGSDVRVYNVRYRGLAAVVSDVPLQAYDPTPENVLAHEHVNEEVMRDGTVLPMSFGTLFRTEADILDLLRSTYDTFDDALAKVENKVEFGLKVLWDRDQVIDALHRNHEQIARLNDEIDRNAGGSTYFARMQLGRLIETALEERGAWYVRDIYTSLRAVTVASRPNKGVGDRVIMNAAFLVERTGEKALDEQIRLLSRRHGDSLEFRYTGPWPPYNFVNIKLELQKVGG